MLIVILLVVFFGIIAFCVAGGVAMGNQEADIRKKLQKRLNEEESEG